MWPFTLRYLIAFVLNNPRLILAIFSSYNSKTVHTPYVGIIICFVERRTTTSPMTHLFANIVLFGCGTTETTVIDRNICIYISVSVTTLATNRGMLSPPNRWNFLQPSSTNVMGIFGFNFDPTGAD